MHRRSAFNGINCKIGRAGQSRMYKGWISEQQVVLYIQDEPQTQCRCAAPLIRGPASDKGETPNSAYSALICSKFSLKGEMEIVIKYL